MSTFRRHSRMSLSKRIELPTLIWRAPTRMSSYPDNKAAHPRRLLRPALVLGAVLMALACRNPGELKKPPGPVRIAFTNTPVPYLPVLLADALGFYQQEGLSVTIDDFSSASKVM